MTQTTSLSALRKQDTINAPADMRAGFDTVGGFELMQRGAKLLAGSTLVPAAYQSVNIKRNKYGEIESQTENTNALSNCVLALNMSQRLGADPLMVMQNLYIVEGRPAWSSQFIIASINACGKFSPLRFTLEDKGEKEVAWTTTVWEGPQGQRRKREVQHQAVIRNKECTAWAIEKATGERLDGPTVSMEMAVAEGWFGKNGSKWQTMPDVMLRYRAASFFGKLYAPELLMGLSSAEEIHDTIELTSVGEGKFAVEEAEHGVTLQDLKAEPKPPVQESAPAATSPETSMATRSETPPQDTKPETPPTEDKTSGGPSPETIAKREALAKLRINAKETWLAAGGELSQAEKLVNEFHAKWSTAQCNKVIDRAFEFAREQLPKDQFLCPKTLNIVVDSDCNGCTVRDEGKCRQWA